MGMFLSLSGIIGKNQNEVVIGLTNYSKSVNGGLEIDNNLTTDDGNCCVMQEVNANTTILYPSDYLEWDKSSKFLSKELDTPVFSFHIHDGDLWMYILYYKGEIIDQFNPIPDYWEEINDAEFERWKGNASKIAELISGVDVKDIEKYLVRWDLDADDTHKAYPDDEFTQEDWQLTDFMKKIGLPYPIDENGKSTGQSYKLWTDELRLKQKSVSNSNINSINNSEKPWWKIW
jgi:hypothetical protein